MLVQDVADLTTFDRLVYWITERHTIHKNRLAKKPKPWTDDEILQSYFFTNPYRENDKTTIWFKKNIREPLATKEEVLMATVIFRWFNLIKTGEAFLANGLSHANCLLLNWKEEKAVNLLTKLWDNGKNQVFTGAYMIKAGNGPRGCKIPGVCSAITNVWQERKYLINICHKQKTLQSLHEALVEFPHLGGFMAYEIVCDLRFTDLLRNATDINTWTNLGPGAKRGINRMLGIPLERAGDGKWKHAKLPSNYLRLMRDLRHKINSVLPKGMPKFELREVEHSLCEFDKYERMRLGEGNAKRRYDGF